MPAEDYDHLMAEVQRLAVLAENQEKLRNFTNWLFDEMQGHGDLDGGTFQDKAVEFGLLEPHTPKEPCSDACRCAEFQCAEEFEDGQVTCYRRTAVIRG